MQLSCSLVNSCVKQSKADPSKDEVRGDADQINEGLQFERDREPKIIGAGRRISGSLMLILADELGSERLDANGTSEQEPTGELIAEFGTERRIKERTSPGQSLEVEKEARNGRMQFKRLGLSFSLHRVFRFPVAFGRFRVCFFIEVD